jgi:hypothetical protein
VIDVMKTSADTLCTIVALHSLEFTRLMLGHSRPMIREKASYERGTRHWTNRPSTFWQGPWVLDDGVCPVPLGAFHESLSLLLTANSAGKNAHHTVPRAAITHKEVLKLLLGGWLRSPTRLPLLGQQVQSMATAPVRACANVRCIPFHFSIRHWSPDARLITSVRTLRHFAA